MSARKRRARKTLVPPSEAVRHKADLSVAELQPIYERLVALSVLFSNANSDITKKLDRIRSAHAYQSAWAEDLEDLRESLAELEDSSCLGRAIDEYEFIITNTSAIVRDLRRLRGDVT
jgi:hypothetical protein